MKGLILGALLAGSISGVGGRIVNPTATISERGPSYCGRHCNCGTGTPQAIDLPDGGSATGAIKPDGNHCSCAEVYRCDPAKEHAPEGNAVCLPERQFSYGGIISTGIRDVP